MKNILTSILFLIFATVTAFSQQPTTTQTTATPSPVPSKAAAAFPQLIGLAGQPAPAFTTTGMDGATYNLEALRGKVIVMNLWGTFCTPCIKEIPKLNTMVEKFKNTDVVFLATAVDDKEPLESFLTQNPFNYKVIPNSFDIVMKYGPRKKPASNDKDAALIPTDSMILPTHVIIDRNGRIAKHFWGYKETFIDELSQAIEQVLAEKKQNTVLK